MRAWQDSLDGVLPVERVCQPGVAGGASSRLDESHSPLGNDEVCKLSIDHGDEDPEIHVTKRDDIVPRQPGAGVGPASFESVWSSHLFWKGIVVGAVVVLLVKTAISIKAPYGIDWYGF